MVRTGHCSVIVLLYCVAMYSNYLDCSVSHNQLLMSEICLKYVLDLLSDSRLSTTSLCIACRYSVCHNYRYI